MASVIRTKRILNDISEFHKNPLHNIHIRLDDNNMNIVKILIIGVDDTPYEGGFFFFKLEFPKSYPFVPPAVTFMTTDPAVRFNPNLYTKGKVCLSILNTWSGPKWTSAQTLSSVLLNLQSIMNEEPLRNEPGFEKAPMEKITNYNKIVQYYTFKVAIERQLGKSVYPEFDNVIHDYFYANRVKYMDKLKVLTSNYNNQNVSSTYNMKVKLKYDILTKKFNKNIEGIDEKNAKVVDNKKESNEEKKED